MEEENLLKVSLICSLTGILVLLLISESIEIKEYKIKDINRKLLNKDIKIKGTITRITETPGLLIFEVNDQTGTLTVIAFKEEPINITKDQKVEIEGKVQEYKNKLEIVTNQIISLS